MFIATRTKTGKEIQANTQVAILQNNPGLNFQDIPGCVGSNLASPIDASSAQDVRGTNLPHSSGSAHDSVLQKKL
ncbi:hypothetical protein KY285_026334 [Solanum tuberosum]|nr:hypothetical protein KY289_026594 [Solanum tuberosum]KAH0665128.1 hypothetical protein KY285_026334 [Solanum tuberosum]